MISNSYNLWVLVGIFFFSSCTFEKPEEPDPRRRKSPIAIASVKHENTYVKVVYGQPYKRGREIFGDLIPYDEVWRTGANEATELTTTGPIRFAGKRVEPGTYTLFTIPREDQFTVILNKELGQWGAFEYDQSHDLLRTEVPTYRTDDVTEVFTIRFSDIVNDSTSIVMNWNQTRIEIPVQFPAGEKATSQP
ncbi:MAG: DUF2911 domain-containing protein [Balneolaceae bacterium]|nr:DUF2911 domain-containing protein [Balneolaceae bacterium]